ncbi:hypothetical protein UFOVP957_44 [uncultured Caudovirales phage]|uniref:Uncharacterized protein n=1 Tax=uncultured Caudovirales phage TaxID=2100421 RepID=A0A6J5R6T1_9CAUD|nr:hypothetical protein UFOVP283_4 [uncultured Caudovirales phage]CAB4174443.1 hypothetical protein UFOVP957_44 [uncultured Caudovirales phage]CAB4192563.1 hypothetical protein UFOVP1231_42 [uncultured Caudovirales phage]
MAQMIRRIPVRVDYLDGSFELALCTGADTIAFERQYDLSANKVSERLEYIWFVAWHNLKRFGKTQLDFDSWMDTVGQVGNDEAAGDTDIAPLENPAPTGSSATLVTSSDLLPL